MPNWIEERRSYELSNTPPFQAWARECTSVVSPASTSAPSPRERTRTSSSPDGASAGNVRAGFSPKEPETSGSAADMTTPSLDDCARPSCRAPPTAAESQGVDDVG